MTIIVARTCFSDARYVRSILMAFVIWFSTVFSDISIFSAISLYFSPLAFDNKNTLLHFGGNVFSASFSFFLVCMTFSSSSSAGAELAAFGKSSIEHTRFFFCLRYDMHLFCYETFVSETSFNKSADMVVADSDSYRINLISKFCCEDSLFAASFPASVKPSSLCLTRFTPADAEP